jgi:hypothetical protein
MTWRWISARPYHAAANTIVFNAAGGLLRDEFAAVAGRDFYTPDFQLNLSRYRR